MRLLETCSLKAVGSVKPTPEDISKIQTTCKPLRDITADDVHIRGLLILGEEPTSKGSVHPRKCLEELRELCINAPMMVGHVWDSAPWGKVFDAIVHDSLPGYTGAVLEVRFFFISDDDGNQRAMEIDSGIHSEGSIAYFFNNAVCSICGKEIGECDHQIFGTYDGKVCYWIPVEITRVAEISFPVFRGAYGKTHGKLSEYADDEQNAAHASLTTLLKGCTYGLPSGGTNEGTVASANNEGKPDGAPEPNGETEPSAPEPTGATAPEGATVESGESNSGGGEGDTVPAAGSLSPPVPSNSEGTPPVGGESAPVQPEPTANADIAHCLVCNAEMQPGCVSATCEACVVSVGRYVGNVKADKQNEHFAVDAFRDLPPGGYDVCGNYNGVYMEIHKDDVGKVTIKSGPDHDQTEKFPGVVVSSEKVPNGTILCGQMVKYRGRQRLDHSAVVSYISGNGSYDDRHFQFKAFDVAVCAGVDQRIVSRTNRLTILESLGDSGSIRMVKLVHVKHEQGSYDLIDAICQVETREGAVVKADYSMLVGPACLSHWEYKRRSVVNALVITVSHPSPDLSVYTCCVGTTMFETYVTGVSAAAGDILEVICDQVTHDAAANKYTCHSPKVISVRRDLTAADPESTLNRLSQLRPTVTTNVLYLGDILPLLKKHPRTYRMYLCGGLVERGRTYHDIDILVDRELTDPEENALLWALGESYADYVDISVSAVGPVGPSIEVLADMTPEAIAKQSVNTKYTNRFVLQKHTRGAMVHFDLRFGRTADDRVWGYTLYGEPSAISGGSKIRCTGKVPHDPQWMELSGDIQPGDPCNGTKLVCHMDILDGGEYELVKQSEDFVEVILHGKQYSGRYVWRRITVEMNTELLHGDEKASSKYIWVMWKPKDQTRGAIENSLCWKVDRGCLLMWDK